MIGTGRLTVSPALTRDMTDTKFLGLAAEVSADFLVTRDRRHLLRLRRIQKTRIITPMKFLKEVS